MPLAPPAGVSRHGHPIAGQHPVVLIHPLAADHRIWTGVASALGSRLVFSYDLPGHGESAPEPGGWSIPAAADQLAALLDRLGVGRAHVVGMSLGGTLALQFATSHPDRAVSVIAADCVPHYPPAVVEVLRSRVADAVEAGMASIADSVLGTWFTADAASRVPEVVERARSAMVATPVDGYAAAVDALVGVDLRNQVADIGCPVLIACGRTDLPAMTAAAEWFAGTIPSARLCWLPGAHAAPVEDAERFVDVAGAFLSEVEARAGVDDVR